MSKFNVGDCVKCIDKCYWATPTQDKVYTVKAVSSVGLGIHDDGGKFSYYYKERFELVEPAPIPHVHAALIKQWADNPKLEFQFKNEHGVWMDTVPHWHVQYEYRIKPETKPDVVKHARASIAEQPGICWTDFIGPYDNIKATFDGETGALKGVELL